MDRRQFVAGSTAAIATLATQPVFAQDAYPSRTVTLINPFPPGGAADVVGRPFAAMLEPIVKQPVVIETKAGAAGAVGAQFAANAKPDGHTLLVHIVSISGFAEVDKLFGRQPKFTRADFIPIARFTEGPMVLVVNAETPYKTAEGSGRRRQEKSRQDRVLVVRPLRRAASAGPAVHECGRHQDAPSADQWRRPGADRDSRQQFAGAGVVDRGGECAHQERQAARARELFGQARALAARRSDHEGTGAATSSSISGSDCSRPRARPKRSSSRSANPRRPRSRPTSSRPRSRISATPSATWISPDFAKFWDEDAKRVEAAVKSIGKVEG